MSNPFHRAIIEVPEMIAGDNTRLREILHPKNDPVAIGYSVAHFRLAVGEASLPHRLKSSETYYVLQGKAKLYIDNHILTLSKDSIALVPPQALQFIENVSSEELVCLCIVEPAWDEADETV